MSWITADEKLHQAGIYLGPLGVHDYEDTVKFNCPFDKMDETMVEIKSKFPKAKIIAGGPGIVEDCACVFVQLGELKDNPNAKLNEIDKRDIGIVIEYAKR